MFNERFARRAAVLAAVMTGIAIADAAPPPNPDPVLHQWFETQHSVTGAWCCNVADGFILADQDWRQAGDHYEASASLRRAAVYGGWVPGSASRKASR